jgi:hypothetical protein
MKIVRNIKNMKTGSVRRLSKKEYQEGKEPARKKIKIDFSLLSPSSLAHAHKKRGTREARNCIIRWE